MHFRLKIFAKIFRDDAGSGEFAQIDHGELRQITEDNCERRGRVAHQSQAHVVVLRPFTVIGDGEDDHLREIVAPEDFQDLRFGEAGIVESEFENLGVAGGDQGAGNAGGTAAGESDSLSQGQLGQARDDVLLGVALEFGGSRGRQRILHEVHEVEIPQQAQTNQARSAWMENEGALYSVALQEIFSRGDVFDDFGGEIFSGEKQAKERVVDRGIFKQCIEDFGRRVIEKRFQFLADGEAGAVSLLIEKGQIHILTQVAEAATQDARLLPRGLNARR